MARDSRAKDNFLDELGIKLDLVDLVSPYGVKGRELFPFIEENTAMGGKAKYLKAGAKGIMLSERYVQGKFFFEKAQKASEPRWERAVNSFMVQCAREVESGKL